MLHETRRWARYQPVTLLFYHITIHFFKQGRLVTASAARELPCTAQLGRDGRSGAILTLSCHLLCTFW